MDTALVVGGTRFVGRHAVEELLDAGYRVTVLTRGRHENPFADRTGVDRVEGDRHDRSALERAREVADPEVVLDCVAYHPEDVRVATEVFADASYVYVSSGAAYGAERIPKREGETELEPCSPEQATDDDPDSYGARKAEGDREVARAAERGVDATSVRPPIVYGPHDYTNRLAFWVDRVRRFDRVVVPGDGTNVWHRAYVEDVARALRVVAEDGAAGEAYNVGDRHAPTLGELVERIAAALDTEVELVTAGERELAAAGLAPTDYVLYREYPHLLSTAKLRELGWRATPAETALERTVEAHVEADRAGDEHGPDRADEERVLAVLDTL
jgi:nucleoside-diphosphate-sugar epimerase